MAWFLPDGYISLSLLDQTQWFSWWYRWRWRSSSLHVLKLKIRHRWSIIYRWLVLELLDIIRGAVRNVLQGFPLLLQLFCQFKLLLFAIRQIVSLTFQLFLLQLQQFPFHSEYFLFQRKKLIIFYSF